jgi:NAD(P)-dependent dehydrogenase (short-subunit alcohol dehydrogenase family)
MMSKRPVVLITGAGRGIGAETAKLAAAQGYDVAVNYKSDAASAAAVVEAVKAKGGKAVAIQADMASEADIERLFAETDKALGRITHFVYNTGIPGKASRLDSAAPAMMREVVDVNVLGALFSLQHAIKRISKKQGGEGGAIVLLSSVAADIGGPNEYVWYAASKGAIESITYGLSKELAGDGIRVNCVSPGASETRVHADAGTPDKLARIAPMIPMGRAGKPEESAAAVMFLLSDAASYISGTVLRVAGGR